MPSPENGSLLTDEEISLAFPKGQFQCLYPWFKITPVPDLPGEDEEEDEASAEGRPETPFS